MYAFGRYLYASTINTTNAIFNPPLAGEGIAREPSPDAEDNVVHQPKPDDVLEVKQFFLEDIKLPLELIDTIIDFAEYWPHTRSVMNRRRGADGSENALYVRAGGGDDRENQLLLRTPPIGFQPLQDWTHSQMSNGPDDSRKPVTEVGPELAGTGRYPWSLEHAPRRDNSTPGEEGDDTLTEEVLKSLDWESVSRGAPCRKIVFTIRSHDQGWGGSSADKGTYRGSFTWFDVGLERMVAFRENLENPASTSQEDKKYTSDSDFPIVLSTRQIIPPVPTGDETMFPLMANKYCLQKNQTATKPFQDHVITWSASDNVDPDSFEGKALEDDGRGKATLSGEFVRNLKVGDCITVWAKARFPGWCNIVEEVKVDVYWAV